MAYRRFLNPTLTRQISYSLLQSSIPIQNPNSIKTLISISPNSQFHPYPSRHFSSKPPQNPNFTPNRSQIDDIDDSDEDGDDEEDYSSADEEEIDGNVVKNLKVIEPARFEERSYNVRAKISEAADIGYKVIGPLQPDDRLFRQFESAFAVVQLGSHQFKVSNGDYIYVEKLKYCEVNDKLVLNKVMLMGSPTQTIIGRPILPEAAVHAVVEEHALDAKVIIFKKKRRKNYRRTKGHRQELTRLRITDIIGIEKVEAPLLKKFRKAKEAEKVAAEDVAVPA